MSERQEMDGTVIPIAPNELGMPEDPSAWLDGAGVPRWLRPVCDSDSSPGFP